MKQWGDEFSYGEVQREKTTKEPLGWDVLTVWVENAHHRAGQRRRGAGGARRPGWRGRRWPLRVQAREELPPEFALINSFQADGAGHLSVGIHQNG